MNDNMHDRSSSGNSHSAAEPFPENWDEARNAETLGLAFDESAAMYTVSAGYADALDNKVVGIFGVASAIIGLAPAVHWGTALMGDSRNAWAVAVLAWLATVATCYGAYRPSDLRVGPDPNVVREDEWTHLTPAKYRYYRLLYMGKSFAFNRAQIARKAKLLAWAMGLTVVEVGALLVAFWYARLA